MAMVFSLGCGSLCRLRIPFLLPVCSMEIKSEALSATDQLPCLGTAPPNYGLCLCCTTGPTACSLVMKTVPRHLNLLPGGLGCTEAEPSPAWYENTAC